MEGVSPGTPASGPRTPRCLTDSRTVAAVPARVAVPSLALAREAPPRAETGSSGGERGTGGIADTRGLVPVPEIGNESDLTERNVIGPVGTDGITTVTATIGNGIGTGIVIGIKTGSGNETEIETGRERKAGTRTRKGAQDGEIRRRGQGTRGATGIVAPAVTGRMRNAAAGRRRGSIGSRGKPRNSRQRSGSPGQSPEHPRNSFLAVFLFIFS